VERLAALCEQLCDNADDQTLKADIIRLLRNIVELRPRERAGHTVDGPTAAAFQEAHKVVINTLSQIAMSDAATATTTATPAEEGSGSSAASSSSDVLLSEAYWIVVSHKFHGLDVTAELLRNLMEALASRGDGRVFNLADACAMYANNQLDPPMIAALFRACRVAGDHHRAKTLLDLLKDLVPGYVATASPGIVRDLQVLKVLPAREGHLFDEMSASQPPPPLAPLPSSGVDEGDKK
jgi:hypothetical protein